MKFILPGLFIGLAAGLLGALCGVGGGIFMVPVFVSFLDLSQKQAIATSLAVIIFTSLAATLSNVRSPVPLIQWPLFAACTVSSVIASYFMAEKMKSMSDETLTRIFAVVLIAAGVWMWIKPAGAKKTSPAAVESGPK